MLLKGASQARLVQFRNDLKSLVNSQPLTLTAVQLCLEQLARIATEVIEGFIADPENQALWWAHALARQCRSALDELIFLAPWIIAADFPEMVNDFPGIDEIPTLRELAKLDTNNFTGHPAHGSPRTLHLRRSNGLISFDCLSRKPVSEPTGG